jgi:hypothetical protein
MHVHTYQEWSALREPNMSQQAELLKKDATIMFVVLTHQAPEQDYT